MAHNRRTQPGPTNGPAPVPSDSSESSALAPVFVVETLHRAEVSFDVDDIDAEDRILARAEALARARGVDVETYGASPCSYPRALFLGPDRAAVERVARAFVAYVRRFRGARFNP